MIDDFPWPLLPGNPHPPVWTGSGFEVGPSRVPILAYEVGTSGWTGGLTRFHEETAGSDHFIDRASRGHALDQLAKYLRTSSPIILEVGCSSGFALRLLRERWPRALVIGCDYVREPLDELATRMPDLPLLLFDMVKCPLPTNSVDAIVLLNVLEHIQDDVAAVGQLYRILKPGGIAVIEVPAGPRLYDVYDKLLLHHRRYSKPDLAWLMKRNALQIIDQSHLGFFAYPGFWLAKYLNRSRVFENEQARKEVVAEEIRTTKNSRLLDMIMRAELFLGRWVSYPFGIRCLMTCMKQTGIQDSRRRSSGRPMK